MVGKHRNHWNRNHWNNWSLWHWSSSASQVEYKKAVTRSTLGLTVLKRRMFTVFTAKELGSTSVRAMCLPPSTPAQAAITLSQKSKCVFYEIKEVDFHVAQLAPIFCCSFQMFKKMKFQMFFLWLHLTFEIRLFSQTATLLACQASRNPGLFWSAEMKRGT